ncbi:hypothetical protein HMPREF9373_0222 [Psychrobacter sp. 1501(2011)]|nr:hypothetical protein HMPREF9373_0222 [Psychrobacter sp. 1501(2011)]
MDTVEQSIAAYKVCQARIEAVQQALDAAFDEETETDSDDVDEAENDSVDNEAE